MEDGDDITEAILDAALHAFGTRGFRATSLSHVALAAKVSRPTLYARYPDKRHLFRAVLRHHYAEALETAAAAAERSAGLEDALRGVLQGYYGTLFDRFHGLPQIEELTLVQSEQAGDLVAEARESFRKLVTRMLRAEVRRGSANLERLGMPLSQLVDLVRLSPLALKGRDTERTHYRRALGNLASVVAKALRED